MRRGQRRGHLILWAVLAPGLITLVIVARSAQPRPNAPSAPPAGATP